MTDKVSSIEDAITAHIKSKGDDSLFPTAWALVVAVSSFNIDQANEDSYVTIRSQGLAHHGLVGLMNVGVDMNSIQVTNEAE